MMCHLVSAQWDQPAALTGLTQYFFLNLTFISIEFSGPWGMVMAIL